MRYRPVFLLALATGLGFKPAPQDEPQGHPALDGYVERSIQGWDVHVDPALLGEDLGAAALELLDHELYEAQRALPGQALEALKEVPIWLCHDYGSFQGVYHPSAQWLLDNGHDVRLARSIQFGVARDFLAWEHDQPAMVIHELSHAYHDRVLGKGHAALIEAFEAARDAGLYEHVLRNNGSTERAYAMNNVDEYFAELSEAFFGTNDYYPFVRAELLVHDPRGFAAIKSAWGL